MKLTRIEVQKKRGKRYNLYGEEDAYLFSVSEDTLVHFGLHKGGVYSDAEMQAIYEYEQQMLCLQQAYRYLARRPHLTIELNQKLKQKNFSDTIIRRTLERLLEKKYLDDHDFIRRFTEDAIQLQHLGPLQIKHKLMSKGASSTDVDEILPQQYDEKRQLQNARYWYQKKTTTQKEQNPENRRQKLAAFLQRKGFYWDTIRQVLGD